VTALVAVLGRVGSDRSPPGRKKTVGARRPRVDLPATVARQDVHSTAAALKRYCHAPPPSQAPASLSHVLAGVAQSPTSMSLAHSHSRPRLGWARSAMSLRDRSAKLHQAGRGHWHFPILDSPVRCAAIHPSSAQPQAQRRRAARSATSPHRAFHGRQLGPLQAQHHGRSLPERPLAQELRSLWKRGYSNPFLRLESG
jgi:hypothetical protein